MAQALYMSGLRIHIDKGGWDTGLHHIKIPLNLLYQQINGILNNGPEILLDEMNTRQIGRIKADHFKINPGNSLGLEDCIISDLCNFSIRTVKPSQLAMLSHMGLYTIHYVFNSAFIAFIQQVKIVDQTIVFSAKG